MNAERALQRLSREKEQWARALFREKARMDYRSEMDGAKEHGREEGIAIGAERELERVLGIARRLKAQGLSPEQITGITGLSPHDIAAL
jgi:predicted transposase/invertase (TIGR01784 family)